MESVRLLNMAVFGLSLRTLNQLKGMVEITLPDAVKVNWTNITHPDLNILLINDIFLESSNIQRLIKNKEMKVLKLIAEQSVLATQANDSFSLIEMDQGILKDWLLKNINHSDQAPSPQDVKNNSLWKVESSTSSKPVTASIDLIKQILNPANGRIKIFDRIGELAVCDTRMQWVWLNTSREQNFTDVSLNYTHATMADLTQPEMQRQHLQLWMWRLLWNSADFLSLAPYRGCFKLIRWPQPELDHYHREVLKMATCFSMGAEITQVAKHLELPEKMVRQFIAASLALGFVVPIQNSQIQFKESAAVEETQELGKVKGFFNRLRAKLGL